MIKQIQICVVAFLLTDWAIGSPSQPDYYADVYPFLKANCISCHNKTTTKAGLNMETPELMKIGGDSGPSIIPGDAEGSLLVEASAHSFDMEMPPKNNKINAVKLTKEQIEILKVWINQGAKASVQQQRQVTWKPLAPGVHPIYAVAMTGDGRFAACGRSNQVSIYDLVSRRLLTHAVDPSEEDGAAHRALVQSLAFSPDGEWMASGGFRKVKIWRKVYKTIAAADLKNSEQQVEPDISKVAKLIEASIAHSFSSDGIQLATADKNGAFKAWNVSSGKQIIEFKGSLQTSMKIAEQEWIKAESAVEQTYQNRLVAKIVARNKSLDDLLEKAQDNIVAMNKKLPKTEEGLKPAVEGVATATKAVEDAQAKIEALEEGITDAKLDKALLAAQDKLITAKEKEVAAIAAVEAVKSNLSDSETQIESINKEKVGNDAEIASAKATEEKAKAAVSSANRELAAQKKILSQIGAKPIEVGFSNDGSQVAAIYDDGSVISWAVSTGKPLAQISIEEDSISTLTIECVDDCSFAIVGKDGVVVSQISSPEWKLETTIEEGLIDRINALAFSPDGKLLAIGDGEPSRSGTIALLNVASGEIARTWKECYEDTVMCLAFSNDGKSLASGAADKIARVFDVATGDQTHLFEGHTHYVMGIAFRCDDRVLATAGADNIVNSWDMGIGERIKKITGWNKEVTSVQFFGATDKLITSSGDNQIRIVSDQGRLSRSITKLPDFVQALAGAPDGITLVGGGEDSVLRIWDGTNSKELAAFGPQ